MIDLLQKVAAFVFTLGVLVTFHELGHYLVARLCGVKVLRFSVGFGKVLASHRFGRDQTEWAISAIPLGGYVKMADERESDVARADLPRAFNRQPVWKRIAIVAAGPLANLLLAVLIFAGTYVHGIPGQIALLAAPPAGSPAAVAGLREGDLVIALDDQSVQSWQDLRWRLLKSSGADTVEMTVKRPGADSAHHTLDLRSLKAGDWETNFLSKLGLRTDLGAPMVQEVLPGKPAEKAGLRTGDRIVSIGAERVRSPSDAAAFTNARPGETLHFVVNRGSTEFETDLTTDVVEQGARKIGVAGLRLGVDPVVVEQRSVIVSYGVLEALRQGAQKTGELSLFTLKMLGRIVTGDASLKNISGPLTMADYAGQSAQQGLLTFAGYLALISISLGVLNLLPVPLLDGGHLMYYLAEIIKGTPVSDRALEVGQRIGMAVLALLMALALFNDLTRLF